VKGKAKEEKKVEIPTKLSKPVEALKKEDKKKKESK
jgi:hypothetical protein